MLLLGWGAPGEEGNAFLAGGLTSDRRRTGEGCGMTCWIED